jgi:hypothetical protein
VSLPDAVTGTYCITSNNLGTLALSYSGDPSLTTSTLTIAVQADGNASIALFDNRYNNVDINPGATGVVPKQDPTAFSLLKITGTYAVGASGRGVLTQNGTASYLFYVVSPTKVVLLPTTTMNPYLVPISHERVLSGEVFEVGNDGPTVHWVQKTFS